MGLTDFYPGEQALADHLSFCQFDVQLFGQTDY